MIIDFHSHVFPEKIAGKTLSALAERSGGTPRFDGTVEGLNKCLSECGADISVNLPVVTKPSQFDSVLRFAIEINQRFKGKGVLSFAGIHPDCEDIKGKMKAVKDAGIKGVKIHPDYQDSYIDCDGYIEILKAAKDLDLIVVTHSGVDDGYKGAPVRCTPERVKRVIKKVGHEKFVLGHFGANKMWEEVETVLAGEKVYFDTAFALRFIDGDLFKRIVLKHGGERVLFATDNPWSGLKEDLDAFYKFGLDKETEELILYKNALKLLNMGE